MISDNIGIGSMLESINCWRSYWHSMQVSRDYCEAEMIAKRAEGNYQKYCLLGQMVFRVRKMPTNRSVDHNNIVIGV